MKNFSAHQKAEDFKTHPTFVGLSKHGELFLGHPEQLCKHAQMSWIFFLFLKGGWHL